MQSWDVRRAVQLVLPVLRADVPLPSCDRRVWLPAWIHGTQLWSRLVRVTCGNLHSTPILEDGCNSVRRVVCFAVCPAGYYGKQCSEVCIKCANNSTCDHRDGHCECLPGWTATDCAIRELMQRLEKQGSFKIELLWWVLGMTCLPSSINLQITISNHLLFKMSENENSFKKNCSIQGDNEWLTAFNSHQIK